MGIWKVSYLCLAVCISVVLFSSLLLSELAVAQTKTATISLVAGWNFVSLPVTPTDTKLETITAPIKDKLESVWHYDGATSNWKVYTTYQAADTLLTLEPGKGYLFKMKVDATLQIVGVLYEFQATNLEANKHYMIGMPNTDVKLSDVQGTCNIQNIELSSTDVNNNKVSIIVGSNTILSSGKGYWIKSTSNCILKIAQSSTSLSLTANPSSVPADGKTVSVITVAASDKKNGVEITLTSSRNSLSEGGVVSVDSLCLGSECFTVAKCTTGGAGDDAGKCSVAVKAAKAGTATITAKASGYADGTTIIKFQSVNLGVVPSDPVIAASGPIKLTDRFDVFMTFEPDWPGDDYQVLVQYLDTCLERNPDTNECMKSCSGGQCKSQIFKNLIGPKSVSDGTFFDKYQNKITAKTKFVLSELKSDINKLSTYAFRVLAGKDVIQPETQRLESSLTFVTFESKCNRANPTIIFEPAQHTIQTEFQKASSPTTKTFVLKIKNNDDEKCINPVSTFEIRLIDRPDPFGVKLNGKIFDKITEPLQQKIQAGSTSQVGELTVNVPGLNKGEYPITVSVEHLDANKEKTPGASGIVQGKAVVKIEEKKECRRSTPLITVSSGTELPNSPTKTGLVVPGETLRYTLSVTNADTAECGPSDFVIESKSIYDMVISKNIPPVNQLSESDKVLEFLNWKLDPQFNTIILNVDGCKDEARSIHIGNCPSKSVEFRLKSNPDTSLKGGNIELYTCVKHKNPVQPADACNAGALNEGGLKMIYSLSDMAAIQDTEAPKVNVKLSPETPLPNRPVTFSIETSDNIQIKSVKLFVDAGLEREWNFKDPESTTLTHMLGGDKIVKNVEHSYYVVATDYKDTKACFPSPCKDPPTVAKFKAEDKPDLVIESIGIKSQEPQVGDMLDVTVTVANKGTVLARGFEVKLKANKPSAKELETQTVIEVLPDKSVTLTFRVQLDKEGEWEIEAAADTGNNRIEEADEANSKVVKVNVKSGAPTTGTGAAPETTLPACEGNLEDHDKILSSTGKLYFTCKSSDFKQTAQCNPVSNYPDEFNLNSAAFKCADTSKKCFISVVQEGCTSSQPSCSLSANPSSGTGSFASTITVSYNRLSSAPNTITVDCGTGPSVTATGCTGTSGKCTATCNYPIVTSQTTHTASASIGNLKCSATTIKNNPQTTLSACEGNLDDVQKILSGTGKLYFTCKNKDFVKTLKCNPVSNYPDEFNLNSQAFKCTDGNKACYIAVTQDGCK